MDLLKLKILVQNGIISVDEARIANGKEPWGTRVTQLNALQYGFFLPTQSIDAYRKILGLPPAIGFLSLSPSGAYIFGGGELLPDGWSDLIVDEYGD